MKKWEVVNKVKSQNSKMKSEEIIKLLLENRGIKTKKDIEEFFNPQVSKVTIESVKINKAQVKKSLERIENAIKNKEQIVIFGDYDVDGICGTAILWETLNSIGAKVMPYIPSRIDEGYGLSIKGIENLKLKIKNCSLIITVDNGIVANKAVSFAAKNGIDVIITDHHSLSENLPKALAIVHTTFLCGAGVAYLLAKEISNKSPNTKYKIPNTHLELVALATVADLVPLVGANRALLKEGLLSLHETKRVGLLALFKEAQINKEIVGVYEIGHIIAPRLNAMGRIADAMDSLRLVCTTNRKRAEELAKKLGSTNRDRQNVTEEAILHAKAKVRNLNMDKDNLLFVYDDSYEQGVIGLVAGRLVEEFYHPAIVLSKGDKYSKASARSINGFNIIEFVREDLGLLVDAGGHPMAAGFTVETSKIPLLEKRFKARAKRLLKDELLQRLIKIDLELDASLITQSLYDAIQKLQPFGMKNPEPVFLTKGLLIENIQLVGNGGKHLKLNFRFLNSDFRIEGIAFGMGEENGFNVGDKIDAVYNLDENRWNGYKKLQLKIKDIKPTGNLRI